MPETATKNLDAEAPYWTHATRTPHRSVLRAIPSPTEGGWDKYDDAGRRKPNGSCLAEADIHVLHNMMRTKMQVAIRFDVQVNQAMACDLVEHVGDDL